MTELTLNLSDKITTLTDGVRVPRVPKVITWSNSTITFSRSDFHRSHQLLLAQSLALTGVF